MGGSLGVARRVMAATVLGTLLAGTIIGAASAAAPPLTVSVAIGGYGISGTVRPGVYVQVAVRDAGGALLGRGLADVYDGFWEFYGFAGAIRAGYTIKATSFNTSGTLNVVKLVVPQLTLVVDRSTDTVGGKGPAGKQVTIEVADGRWDHWGESYFETRSASVGSNGLYSYDFGAQGIDIRGGAQATVTWTNLAHTKSVSRSAEVARIMFGIGRSTLWGTVRRNVHVEATLKDGSLNTVATGNAVGDASGSFEGTFTTADDDEYLVKGGEWFSAPAIAADVDWRVPKGITAVDRVSDKIAGSCFPGGRYEVYAVDPLLWVETVRFGNAGSTGAFTRDVTATFNVRSNSYIEVICWTAGGDFVWDSWGTPPDSWSQTMTAHPAGAEL